MTTLREAAQQALTVLDGMEQNYGNLWQVNASPEGLDALCAALRTALAEPEPRNQCGETCERAKLCATCARGIDGVEQEPVAWGMRRPDGLILDVICPEEHERMQGEYTVPLYAAPQLPERKPMTDEEIEQAYRKIWRYIPSDFGYTAQNWIEQGIKYAERIHGITGETE